jgi:single-strand DNA-binding protein
MFEAIIQGRLGNDPEMRYTSNGTAVLNFSVAHNWEYKGQPKSKWVKATIWGDLAEEMNNEKFTKGQLVRVKGSITFSIWEKNDGTRVEEVESRVSDIERVELPATLLTAPRSE